MRRLVIRRVPLALVLTGLFLAQALPAAASLPKLPSITSPAPFGCTTSDRYVVCANDPHLTDPVILDQLKALADSTSAGDVIRVAEYGWWYRKASTPFDYTHIYNLTHAIIDAAARGVDVKVLVDQKSNPALNPDIQVPGLTQAYDELKSALGSNLIQCGKDPSSQSLCLETSDPNAIEHNKLFLFQVAGTKKVVLSSANLAPESQNLYQNMVSITNDGDLYDFYSGYWDRMAANNWNGWTTTTDRQHTGTLNPLTGLIETKGYVYPHDQFQDTVLNILNSVKACPDSTNRKVWMAFSEVNKARLQASSNAILNRITQLVGLNCAVRVLVSSNDTDQTTFNLLQAAGALVAYMPNLHSKYIIVDASSTGMSGGSQQLREYVWTGSANLTAGSAWTSAESDAWIEQHDVVRKYVSNYTCMWNRNSTDSMDNDDTCA